MGPSGRGCGPFAMAAMLATACLLLAGCAHAQEDTPMQAPAADAILPGEGPFQRFIVRYRADSAGAGDPAAAARRLQRTVDEAGLAPATSASWQRRLAVGGDVFVLDRPLDRAAARRLVGAFLADPEVESIEVDRMLGFDPPGRRPMRER